MKKFNHKFDVRFDSDTMSDRKGFNSSYEYCYDYIAMYNGTNESCVLILVVMDVSCEGKIFNPSHYRHCTPIFSIFSTNGTKKWGEF